MRPGRAVIKDALATDNTDDTDKFPFSYLGFIRWPKISSWRNRQKPTSRRADPRLIRHHKRGCPPEPGPVGNGLHSTLIQAPPNPGVHKETPATGPAPGPAGPEAWQ